MKRLRSPRSGVVVNCDDDTAARIGWPQADESAATETDDSTCPECGFVAKSPAGLASHSRTHDS